MLVGSFEVRPIVETVYSNDVGVPHDTGVSRVHIRLDDCTKEEVTELARQYNIIGVIPAELPLTADDLHHMLGEPVWCERIGGYEEEFDVRCSCWALVDERDGKIFTRHETGPIGMFYDESEIGTKFLPYKHKIGG